MSINQSKIRNFCIIAHIDHGKSTLADRIIEQTGLLTSREMQAQVLDNMDLERERGITIKSQAVRIIYKAKNGEEYIFNLIDTPGHVDFNYEVSRSLAACDGAILVVDAAQGIEAQTLANVYLALDHDLDVMPVINKIDLPSAQPDFVIEEIENVIGIEAQDAPKISAKTGLNVDLVLEQIVEKIPAPSGDPDAPLQALIFDAVYDSYKGVIVFCRIMEGTVKSGDLIRMMATKAEDDVVEVGYFGAGQFIPCEELSAGMVGYLTAGIKNVRDTRIGDTITHASRPCSAPLPGYKKVNPMVYCGVYPADSAKYPDLRDALENGGNNQEENKVITSEFFTKFNVATDKKFCLKKDNINWEVAVIDNKVSTELIDNNVRHYQIAEFTEEYLNNYALSNGVWQAYPYTYDKASCDNAPELFNEGMAEVFDVTDSSDLLEVIEASYNIDNLEYIDGKYTGKVGTILEGFIIIVSNNELVFKNDVVEFTYTIGGIQIDIPQEALDAMEEYWQQEQAA